LLLGRQVGHHLAVELHFQLGHSLDQALRGPGQVDALGALVARVRQARHPAAAFQAFDDVAETGLADFQHVGELGLHHPVVARQMRQHPPLRTGDAERLHEVVVGAAPHARYVVDQEAQADTVAGVIVEFGGDQVGTGTCAAGQRHVGGAAGLGDRLGDFRDADGFLLGDWHGGRRAERECRAV